LPGAVDLDCGIQLRGSIDLVERRPSGEARVTDHKTGRPPGKGYRSIEGGKSLQPLFYALAAEKIFDGRAEVIEGRLYFCTSRGGFVDQVVAVDDETRGVAAQVADTISNAVSQPFLPAAPDKDACLSCDYRVVCGPYEELRVGRKPEGNLEPLLSLRSVP
jgi:CRISPR/Cas system-associated exonuclease Cas4 (RecB family)